VLQGTFRAFEDRCPHRLAPLSEGRVNPESGHLECAYHGWTFGPDGGCSGIPQAPDESRLMAQQSRRACVQSYPTKVRPGGGGGRENRGVGRGSNQSEVAVW
jgi:phenylpropionate dioxygenase-like ring-hydroxylating dioxygenase large terminal subunit